MLDPSAPERLGTQGTRSHPPNQGAPTQEPSTQRGWGPKRGSPTLPTEQLNHSIPSSKVHSILCQTPVSERVWGRKRGSPTLPTKQLNHSIPSSKVHSIPCQTQRGWGPKGDGPTLPTRVHPPKSSSPHRKTTVSISRGITSTKFLSSVYLDVIIYV